MINAIREALIPRRLNETEILWAIRIAAVVALTILLLLLATSLGVIKPKNAAVVGALLALSGVLVAQVVNTKIARSSQEHQRNLEDQRAHAALVQAYLEQMGTLLSSSHALPEAHVILQAQTLAVLEGLREDPTRKSIVLRFVYWSKMISKDPNAENANAEIAPISLRWANLKGVDLRGVDLRHVVLSGADLSNADFTEANLSGADLTEANLSDATLTNAILNEADISGADLSNVELSEAQRAAIGKSKQAESELFEFGHFLWSIDALKRAKQDSITPTYVKEAVTDPNRLIVYTPHTQNTIAGWVAQKAALCCS